jgi:hypothetical protein
MFTHNGLFAHWCVNIITGIRKKQIKQWTVETGPQIGEFGDAREALVQSLCVFRPNLTGCFGAS